MRQALKVFIRIQGQVEMAICVTLMALIVGTIIFQIVARYVFNMPVPWMEEMVTIFFILLTLLAAAIAAKEKRHILVDLFPRGPVSRFLGVVMSILTMITLITLIAHIGPILKVEFRRTTISLPSNFPIAYYNSLPLIYCFCSIILSTIYDVIFERKEDQEALV
tara:strand:+ start:374 stop:865 length:492 start_codon:yes stop_codon:yes gene_type:complete